MFIKNFIQPLSNEFVDEAIKSGVLSKLFDGATGAPIGNLELSAAPMGSAAAGLWIDPTKATDEQQTT